MQRFVSICAPRTWLQGILIFILFLVAIQIVSAAVEASPLGTSAPFAWEEMLLTLLTSAPFIVLALAMLSHQANLQDRLAILVATDALTGLPNRREFLRRTSEHPRLGSGVMMMLDIDHFKAVNDTYGHAYGDMFLRIVADRMRDLAGPEIVLGRLGGEEFAVFAPHNCMDEARVLALRLTNGFVLPGPYGEALDLTISVGLAQGHPAILVETLLDQADEAMYQAKAAGRAQIAVWSCAKDIEVTRRPWSRRPSKPIEHVT